MLSLDDCYVWVCGWDYMEGVCMKVEEEPDEEEEEEGPLCPGWVHWEEDGMKKGKNVDWLN